MYSITKRSRPVACKIRPYSAADLVCEVDPFRTALPCIAAGCRMPTRMHGQGVSIEPLGHAFAMQR